jgi:hypothetical protein
MVGGAAYLCLYAYLLFSLSLLLSASAIDGKASISALDVIEPRENDKIITSSVRVVLGLRTPETPAHEPPSDALAVYDPTAGRPEIDGKVCLAIYHGESWDNWNITVNLNSLTRQQKH